jgi:hypothetical protein
MSATTLITLMAQATLPTPFPDAIGGSCATVFATELTQGSQSTLPMNPGATDGTVIYRRSYDGFPASLHYTCKAGLITDLAVLVEHLSETNARAFATKQRAQIEARIGLSCSASNDVDTSERQSPSSPPSQSLQALKELHEWKLPNGQAASISLMYMAEKKTWAVLMSAPRYPTCAWPP